MSTWRILLIIIPIVCVVVAIFILRKRKTIEHSELMSPVLNESRLVPSFFCTRIESPILSNTFDEALSSIRFYTDLQQSALSNLNARILSAHGDTDSIIVQSIRMNASRRELVVGWSRRGDQRIKETTAEIATQSGGGKALPFLRNKEDGTILEMMKGLSKTPERLAQASALIVSTAHIISGADLAKKLDLMSNDVKFLLAARHIDQISKLEEIYAHSRAILSGQINDCSIAELRRTLGELTNLRSQWRRELDFNLRQIPDPAKRSWVRRRLSRKRTQDRKIAEQLTPLARQIMLIDFSLRIQLAISDAIELNSHFLFDVLPEEMRRLEILASDFKEKTAYISKGHEYERRKVDEIAKHFDRANAIYSSFLPQSKEY